MYIYMLKNVTIVICRTCKHLFVDVKHANEYSFARCAVLGKQCLVSGDINYPYADRSRRDFTMCGQEGKYYEKSQVETHTYAAFNKH